MWRTNAGLTERHSYDSRPHQWPGLRRGIVSAPRLWERQNPLLMRRWLARISGSRIIVRSTSSATPSSGGPALLQLLRTSSSVESSSFALSEAIKTSTTVSTITFAIYVALTYILPSRSGEVRQPHWLPCHGLGVSLPPFLHYAAPAVPTSLFPCALLLNPHCLRRL